MEQFLQDHVEGLRSFLRRLSGDEDLASDLTQDALVRALDRRASLRQTPNKTWLWTIGYRVWVDWLRQKRNRPEAIDQHLADARSIAPDSACELSEDIHLVLSAMKSLPPRQQQVLTLLACDQLSMAEIAEVTGLTIAAVQSNLYAARQQLRRKFRDLAGSKHPPTPAP